MGRITYWSIEERCREVAVNEPAAEAERHPTHNTERQKFHTFCY